MAAVLRARGLQESAILEAEGRKQAQIAIAEADAQTLQREGEAIARDDVALAMRLAALPMRNDLDGTAALVAALDLVVSVDTSIAHLAGALGKPVSILLPFAADWRSRRSTFPTSTTASSTSSPIAIARPPSVIVLIDSPSS